MLEVFVMLGLLGLVIFLMLVGMVLIIVEERIWDERSINPPGSVDLE